MDAKSIPSRKDKLTVIDTCYTCKDWLLTGKNGEPDLQRQGKAYSGEEEEEVITIIILMFIIRRFSYNIMLLNYKKWLWLSTVTTDHEKVLLFIIISCLVFDQGVLHLKYVTYTRVRSVGRDVKCLIFAVTAAHPVKYSTDILCVRVVQTT